VESTCERKSWIAVSWSALVAGLPSDVRVRRDVRQVDRKWLGEVPVQFLLPWDDEHVDRQTTLALFDAFASKEKTLHANPGDHRTIRWVGVDNEFLARHLGQRG
jgi:hypothetical protein